MRRIFCTFCGTAALLLQGSGALLGQCTREVIYAVQDGFLEPQCVRQLILRKKKMEVLPPGMGRYTGMQILDIQKNRLRDLPAEAAALNALQQLIASGNELRRFP